MKFWNTQVGKLTKEQKDAFFCGVGMSAVFCGLLAYGMGYLAGSYSGRVVGRDETQRDAAQRGAGVYEVDAKTGFVSFHWTEFPPRTVILRDRNFSP